MNSRGEICAARGLQTVLEGTVTNWRSPRSGLKTSNTTTAGLSRMALVKPLLLRVTSQTTSKPLAQAELLPEHHRNSYKNEVARTVRNEKRLRGFEEGAYISCRPDERASSIIPSEDDDAIDRMGCRRKLI